MQAIILILASVNILMTISLLFSLMASERRRKGKEDISNDAIARLESYISRGFESLERENDEFRKEVSSYLEKSLNASISSQSDLFSRSEAQTKSMTETVSHMSERLSASLMDLKLASKGEMEAFAKALQSEFEKVRAENDKSSQTLAEQTKTLVTLVRSDMEKIRFDNEKKLEEMRKTVDEKLQSTLELRLTESFKLVSNNLDQLRAALGEINKLSRDVSDLNKIFGNVKSRGVWGEVQVEAILSDILTPEQYVRNFHPRIRSQEVVEFAVRLPGRDSGEVYIPIDSKFPKEDYERYVDALSSADDNAIRLSLKALRERVRKEAPSLVIPLLRSFDPSLRCPQEGEPSYTGFIGKEDGKLDFSLPASALHAIIWACNPWPKAYGMLSGSPLYITGVWGSAFDEAEDAAEAPGTVVGVVKGRGLKIATGKGYLYASKVLPPARKEMDALSYVNGNRAILGSVLE